jgi:hypothetical protein
MSVGFSEVKTGAPNHCSIGAELAQPGAPKRVRHPFGIRDLAQERAITPSLGARGVTIPYPEGRHMSARPPFGARLQP